MGIFAITKQQDNTTEKVFKLMMIRQLAILFGCLALGELVIQLTHIPLPSSILGMLLLTLLLKLKVIRLEWVRSISEFLVSNIGFFFVPPGVAIMLYFDIIKAQFWPIVGASVASTVLVLAVTGWVHQIYGRAIRHEHISSATANNTGNTNNKSANDTKGEAK